MNESLTLCPGCMNAPADEYGCSVCGYIAGSPANPLHLPAGSVLAERYMVGSVHKKDGEGYTYIARDRVTDRRVWVREYLPDALAGRNRRTLEAVARAGSETQFKSLRGDFLEIAACLQHTDAPDGILPVIDHFEQHNTAYAVYPYLEGITLAGYLQTGAALDWEQTHLLFLPVLSSLSALHEKGVIHRGISPETLFLDTEGNLLLTDFLVAPARILKSELNANICAGYAAPEQYSLSSWQGTWTDVYAVAAVMYFALTGQTPPVSVNRVKQDTLRPIAAFGLDMPAYAAEAITAALVLAPDRRVATAGDLVQRMRKPQPTDPTARPMQAASANYTAGSRSKKKKKKKRRRRYSNFPYYLLSLVLSTALLVPLVNSGFREFAGVDIFDKEYTLSMQGGSSQAPSTGLDTSGGGETANNVYKLPNFVGQYLDTIKTDRNYVVKYEIVEVHEHSESVPTGMVIEQDVAAGTEVPDVITVTLTISKGQQPLPDLKNMDLAEVKEMLAEYEIEYQLIPMYDDKVKAGRIVKYYRAPDMISIYISEGPESSTAGQLISGEIIDPNADAQSSEITRP